MLTYPGGMPLWTNSVCQRDGSFHSIINIGPCFDGSDRGGSKPAVSTVSDSRLDYSFRQGLTSVNSGIHAIAGWCPDSWSVLVTLRRYWRDLFPQLLDFRQVIMIFDELEIYDESIARFFELCQGDIVNMAAALNLVRLGRLTKPDLGKAIARGNAYEMGRWLWQIREDYPEFGTNLRQESLPVGFSELSPFDSVEAVCGLDPEAWKIAIALLRDRQTLFPLLPEETSPRSAENSIFLFGVILKDMRVGDGRLVRLYKLCDERNECLAAVMMAIASDLLSPEALAEVIDREERLDCDQLCRQVQERVTLASMLANAGV